MKILVINGSPRGKYSVTVHTCMYLEKRYPSNKFEYITPGISIRSMEKDMSKALEKMQEADLLLFSYPVYTFLCPSQLHRFIARVKESGVDLSGKFVTQISTSKHFYDMTAHRYIEENCFDMNMKVIHGLSADMDDLTTEKGRRDAESFFEYVCYSVENNIYEKPLFANPVERQAYTASIKPCEKKKGFDTVIVGDIPKEDTELMEMVEDFKRAYPYETRLVNISEYPFQGGCLGCFNCAGDGKCIYKDNFDTFLRENIQTADAIVYAFRIKDHSMGYTFKMYDDRQFCNGHRTVTQGMPFAYVVAGDYENEGNLRNVIESRAEVGHNFLSGVGFDAFSIEKTAQRLSYAIENKYIQPRSFWGVGGMKIFRDLIWLMRGIMKADHEFYKKNGDYDFPQKQTPKMLGMCVLGSMIRNPKLKGKMGNKVNEGMAMPYDKVIKNVTAKTFREATVYSKKKKECIK